ncbi:MAG: ATP-binding cassette domain-containing protein, partial [Candidatus Korarchaeota archaeon]|nr:ATP-binding cassette domain-containing protein [Candidatus Korarchaeota archaeon]
MEAAEPRGHAGPLLTAHIRSAGSRGEPVLRDVELKLWPGETLLVLGPSGSGKTTLILALTGVLSGLLGGYVDGDVRLAGVDPATREGFEAVPRLVGVVLQDPDKQISMPTPYDEVMFTLENLGYPEEEASARTEEILRWAGLGDKMFREVESLSGGEKKRLCIAASIVHGPRLLIFDEPTANLDPRGVGSMLGYMERLRARGYSMIVVEHKAGYFLGRADRILVLDSGRVAMALEERPAASELRGLEDLGIDTGLLRPRERRRAVESEAMVELRGVSYRYRGARQYALRNVDLEVPKGSIYALVGHNGSGKT